MIGIRNGIILSFIFWITLICIVNADDTPAIKNNRVGCWYYTTESALEVLKSIILPEDEIIFGVQKQDLSYEEKNILDGEYYYNAFNDAINFISNDIKKTEIEKTKLIYWYYYTPNDYNFNFNTILKIISDAHSSHYEYSIEVK